MKNKVKYRFISYDSFHDAVDKNVLLSKRFKSIVIILYSQDFHKHK